MSYLCLSDPRTRSHLVDERFPFDEGCQLFQPISEIEGRFVRYFLTPAAPGLSVPPGSHCGPARFIRPLSGCTCSSAGPGKSAVTPPGAVPPITPQAGWQVARVCPNPSGGVKRILQDFHRSQLVSFFRILCGTALSLRTIHSHYSGKS